MGDRRLDLSAAAAHRSVGVRPCARDVDRGLHVGPGGRAEAALEGGGADSLDLAFKAFTGGSVVSLFGEGEGEASASVTIDITTEHEVRNTNK